MLKEFPEKLSTRSITPLSSEISVSRFGAVSASLKFDVGGSTRNTSLHASHSTLLEADKSPIS